MKRALTKNWGLKLLAFVFSVLLWIIVMNIEDPVDERTFSGIQVTVTHPEIGAIHIRFWMTAGRYPQQ